MKKNGLTDVNIIDLNDWRMEKNCKYYKLVGLIMPVWTDTSIITGWRQPCVRVEPPSDYTSVITSDHAAYVFYVTQQL